MRYIINFFQHCYKGEYMKGKYVDLTWCILCTGKAQEVWRNTVYPLLLEDISNL